MSGAGLEVAVLQCEGVPGDPAANLALLEERAREAAALGADLLVTPELYLSGFFIGEQVEALASPRHGASLEAVRAVARRHRLALLLGYPERDGAAIYNAAALIDAGGGWLGNYRKHRLSGAFEKAVFTRGDGTDTVVELRGVRTGVLICYDLEFPENARRLALAGVELVLAPTALSARFAIVAQKLVPTRAFENGLFIAYADRCGREHGYAYAGASCIVGPDGEDLARAGEGDALLHARVDPGRYAEVRRRLPYLEDLRAR